MKNGQAIVVLLVVASPALAEPGTDPWAQVPGLPTSCYSTEDSFRDRAYSATAALENEKTRQEETNNAIAQQLRDLDMTEQQQRMMTYMMEHPEDAQRYMESIQQTGQQVQEQTPEMTNRSLQLLAELEDLQSKYDAALSQATAPLEQRRQELYDSWGSGSCTEAQIAETVTLIGKENAAYETLCADWWKEGQAFHAWFAEFKKFQIDTAAQQDEQDSAKLSYEVMGIPADDYRGTGYLRAPIEYLRQANQVFAKRRTGPISQDIGSCGDHG